MWTSLQNSNSGFNLAELSIINIIDGSEGCKEGSRMGFYGLILWFFILLYCMAGQFVLCEEYFVPVLSNLGNRLNMPEDVQGATLLAVGSSSPELFTALLGIIFYPNDNPGPGTNVGSAVFNMCCIIGFSALAAPKTAKLLPTPLIRDSVFYLIGTLILFLHYEVISPNIMEFWEACIITGWWILYVVVINYTSKIEQCIVKKCCCCLKEKQAFSHASVQNKETTTVLLNDDGYQAPDSVQLVTQLKNENTEEKKPEYVKKRSSVYYDGRRATITAGSKKEDPGILFDDDVDDMASVMQIDYMKNFNPENIHIIKSPEEEDEDDNVTTFNDNLQTVLNDLNKEEKTKINKGYIVVVDPEARHQLKHGNVDGLKEQKHKHLYLRRRTLMEYVSYQEKKIQFAEEHGHGDEAHAEHSGFGKFIHRLLYPWSLLFKCIIPAPEGGCTQKAIAFTIFLIVIDLGILTFIVVDSAEKVGSCLNIPGDLLGITLLAVGSSLPDCISSILVARQMKLDMAVANAFGSNIFDVNMCVGFSFMLGSMAKKFKPIDLGAADIFSELIVVAAVFQIIFWIVISITKLYLRKWIGGILVALYVAFAVTFSIIYIKSYDDTKKPQGN